MHIFPRQKRVLTYPPPRACAGRAWGVKPPRPPRALRGIPFLLLSLPFPPPPSFSFSSSSFPFSPSFFRPHFVALLTCP
jgi:hypothetical protein